MALIAADIVAELRRRIAARELRPGELLTFRDLMREWDVSMHIAFKALRLMRDEGLAGKVRRVHGMVVTEDAASIASAWRPPPPASLGFRTQVVGIAIDLADAEGLAAVSMRRIAERLGVATMTPYRHVRPRARLEILMADAVFAEHPPPEHVGVWRAQLEQLCRMQWQMYRSRPWLARTVCFQSSELNPHVVAHVEWAMRAMAGVHLPAQTVSQIAATAADFVRGTALDLGGDDDDTALFEFGLQRLLEGFALLESAGRR
ncbi:MAG TPA: GntR family transcriptional regulator [Dactylosporangium sp.]|nr:GntR family transcriptional regulator [Dactylosporangium sp.]